MMNIYTETTFSIKCSDSAKSDALFDYACDLFLESPINPVNEPLPIQQGNLVYGQIRFYDDKPATKLAEFIRLFDDCVVSKLDEPYLVYHKPCNHEPGSQSGVGCGKAVTTYSGVFGNG